MRVFFADSEENAPHPNPLPEYRAREYWANATALLMMPVTLTLLRQSVNNTAMAYFLPGQIGCLDSQVDEYVAAHAQAMHCFEVEELISLFVSLAGELEKSTAKAELSAAARREAIEEFKHLSNVGSRIRGMVVQLRAQGYIVADIDTLMRTLIHCRAAADADEIAAERDLAANGQMRSRPIQELIDGLQRRDDAAG